MKSIVLCTAVAALTALTAVPVLASTQPFQNLKFNHATFELALCWTGPGGKAHTCPIDDVSYLDLTTAPTLGGITTAVATVGTGTGSSGGTLTFVKHEEDQDWWRQCQAALQAKCEVDLVITFKFSDPGAPILQTTNGTSQATTFESAGCKSIKLSNITAISGPTGGQGWQGHDCDRDVPNVYVVTFSSLQFPVPAK